MHIRKFSKYGTRTEFRIGEHDETKCDEHYWLLNQVCAMCRMPELVNQSGWGVLFQLVQSFRDKVSGF